MSPAWSLYRWPRLLALDSRRRPEQRGRAAIISATHRLAEEQVTDIIFLVERLESLVATGKKLPLTNNVVLDQASVLELIDQLRVAVPDEVRQARRITEEAARITERAGEEGEAVIARAQEQAAGLLREAPGATRELQLRDRYLALGADLELAGPIDARLRMLRTNRGILLRGSVDAPLRRTCARCLDPFVEEVRVQVSEEFLPTV